MFEIVKGRSSTLLAELTFRHTFYLVRDVHVVDIRVAWLVYLACLRSHVLRAYFNFESKQAISVTLFGRRPNNNDSVNSKRAHAPPPRAFVIFSVPVVANLSENLCPRLGNLSILLEAVKVVPFSIFDLKICLIG